VREVFHSMLAVALEESRKATLINTAQNGSTGAEGDHCGVIHSDE